VFVGYGTEACRTKQKTKNEQYFFPKKKGVGKAVFVDYSKEACRTIEDNLESCHFDDRSLVVCVCMCV